MSTIIISWIIRAYWIEMMCHIIVENGYNSLGLLMVGFIPIIEGFYWLKKTS